jgi:hypothetical protein
MATFQRDYAAHAQATIEPFGGRYLVRGVARRTTSRSPRCVSARRIRGNISSRGCRSRGRQCATCMRSRFANHPRLITQMPMTLRRRVAQKARRGVK